MFYVYILSNQRHTVFYTGMTNDLAKRMFEHKHKLNSGFTAKYNCNKLLYCEEFKDGDEAAYREKQIKRYRRDWNQNLIAAMNPEWRDLSLEFLAGY